MYYSRLLEHISQVNILGILYLLNFTISNNIMLGRHTYDNMAVSMDKVLNEFKIQNKITLIVTDNADNFVKSFR